MLISDSRDLGLRLREARQARRWSQARVADAIGVSRYWVMALEKGSEAADLGKILKLVRLLGLTLDVRSDQTDSSGAPAPQDERIPDLNAILERALAGDDRALFG
jgi:transcriptional regulator with XRE-family HTH domain